MGLGDALTLMYLTMGSQLTFMGQPRVITDSARYIPALVVDLVSIAWGVDNVQPQPDPILRDDYAQSRQDTRIDPTEQSILPCETV